MWFDGWDSVGRILVLGTLGYIALIVILRVSGKRSLSKMNSFDFVVNVTLGSVFASLILTNSVSLSDGVIALALLIFLQFVVTWLAVRFRWFKSVIKGDPQLVFWRGQYLDDILRRERVPQDEVRSAMRDSNVMAYDSAAAVLETDGRITVIQLESEDLPHALKHVSRD